MTVNSACHPDCTISSLRSVISLIFSFLQCSGALRGGGAGSWGVIIDATLRTLPIFNATGHSVNVLTATLEQTASLMTTHAKHISDWDQVWAGKYFILSGSTTNGTLFISTLFKDLDGDTSKAQMSAFLTDAAKIEAAIQDETTVTTFVNDIIGSADDSYGFNGILSSRLVPCSVYSDAPESVSPVYAAYFTRYTINPWKPRCWGCVSFPRCSMILFKAHHSRRSRAILSLFSPPRSRSIVDTHARPPVPGRR